MRARHLLAAALAAAACGWAQPATVRATATASYQLAPPETLTSTQATFPLFLDFTADAGEEMVFMGVDVSSSSANVTGSGMDFSAFSFTPTMPLFNGWGQLFGTGFGPSASESSVEYDTATDPIPPGNYRVGTLAVDLAQAGVGPGAVVEISVNAFDSVIGIEVPTQQGTFVFIDLTYNPGSQTIRTPRPGGGGAVPEPATFLLAACGITALAGAARRRRNA